MYYVKVLCFFMNIDSRVTKEDTMKQIVNRILGVTVLVGLILISLSCSKNPEEQGESSRTQSTEKPGAKGTDANEISPAVSVQIVLDKDENGVVIRLIGEGEDGIWRLNDDQNDIEVIRLNGDMFAVRASIAQMGKVETQIKMIPGQTIALAGVGNKRISLKCPSN